MIRKAFVLLFTFLSACVPGTMYRPDASAAMSDLDPATEQREWLEYLEKIRRSCWAQSINDFWGRVKDRQRGVARFKTMYSCERVLTDESLYKWHPEAACSSTEKDGLTIWACEMKISVRLYRLDHCIIVTIDEDLMIWCDPKRGSIPDDVFKLL